MRLNKLRMLFNEIESLPEAALARDLSKGIAAAANRHITFAPLVSLIFAAQAAAAVIVGWLSLPLIQQTIDERAVITINIEALPMEWLQWARESQTVLEQTLQAITQPLPLEASTMMILTFIVAVSLMWVTGNGLVITSLARRRT